MLVQLIGSNNKKSNLQATLIALKKVTKAETRKIDLRYKKTSSKKNAVTKKTSKKSKTSKSEK